VQEGARRHASSGKDARFQDAAAVSLGIYREGSITLLPSDDDLTQTLKSIIKFLAPSEVVLFDLDVPNPGDLRNRIGKFKET